MGDSNSTENATKHFLTESETLKKLGAAEQAVKTFEKLRKSPVSPTKRALTKLGMPGILPCTYTFVYIKQETYECKTNLWYFVWSFGKL
jgi:hypothetical protein